MSRARVSIVLLNLTGALVTAGGLLDLSASSPPELWAPLLGQPVASLSPQVAGLLTALLHALGGSLVAIGLGTLILVNGPLRRGEPWSGLAIGVLVLVSEGMNSLQMQAAGAAYFAGPLIFIAPAAIGLGLAYWPSPAFRPSAGPSLGRSG